MSFNLIFFVGFRLRTVILGLLSGRLRGRLGGLILVCRHLILLTSTYTDYHSPSPFYPGSKHPGGCRLCDMSAWLHDSKSRAPHRHGAESFTGVPCRIGGADEVLVKAPLHQTTEPVAAVPLDVPISRIQRLRHQRQDVTASRIEDVDR